MTSFGVLLTVLFLISMTPHPGEIFGSLRTVRGDPGRGSINNCTPDKSNFTAEWEPRVINSNENATLYYNYTVRDSCTDYDHDRFGKVGKCIKKSCCAYGTYISSLCAGDDTACCFKEDTCSGSTGSGGGGLDCPGTHRYSARGTAYYPANNPLEGGFVDMRGVRLHTLQQFLAGSASYVSVAMDNHAGIAYGTTICIPEMNHRYNKHIVFKVVDTGSAFFGKGHSRIDICVSSLANSYDSTINGHLTLVFP